MNAPVPAIARVQFELSGGWRQNAAIVACYVGLVALVAGMSYRVSGPNGARDVDSAFLVIITFVQGAIMLLIASGAVRRAMLRDFQTGMIESHRVSPMSGRAMIVGYLTGATAQAALLYLAGLGLGSYFAISYVNSGSYGPILAGAWIAGQLALLPLALLLLAATLLVAVGSRGRANLTFFLLIGSIGGVFIFWLVPGIALLCSGMSAMIVLSKFGAGPRWTGALPTEMAWAVLFQIAIGIVLLAAAARKIRRPERPAFSMLLAMLLLILSWAVLVTGWKYRVKFALFTSDGLATYWQGVATLATFLVAGLLPVAASAGHCAAAKRRLRDARFLLIPAAVWLGALFLLPVIAAARARVYAAPEPVLMYVAAAIVLAVSIWTDHVALHWAAAAQKNQLIVIAIIWVVLKLVPLLLYGVALAAADAVNGEVTPWLAMLSPVGMFVVEWQEPEFIVGILWQIVAAIGLMVVARRFHSARDLGARAEDCSRESDAGRDSRKSVREGILARMAFR